MYRCGSWTIKKTERQRIDVFKLWCWRRPLRVPCTGSKEIKPVSPKGNQCWIFIGRTDVEAETPILWPPDAKTDSLEKTLMLGNIEGRRRRGRQRMRWLGGITNSQCLLKLLSIRSVMPSNHLILCRPLLLLPSIFPIIGVFYNESVLHIRWPKYWNFSFSISPSNKYSGLISFRIDWFDLAVQGTLKSLLQRLSSKASILQCSRGWDGWLASLNRWSEFA